MVEHRHPELGLRAVVVAVKVLEPSGKLIGNEHEATAVFRQDAMHSLRCHILHGEADPLRLDRIGVVAFGCSIFRREFHRSLVTFHRLAEYRRLFSIEVDERLHGETQRMALVGAGASDKGCEKNGILFPAGHYLGGVGVAYDCGHSRQHRPGEIVFRKSEADISLVYDFLQSRRQDINGQCADILL